MKVKIVNESKHPLPSYETPASAGMDLRANLDEPVVLKSLERALIQLDYILNCLLDMKHKSGQGAALQ